MPVFSPEKSRIFLLAAFANLYSSRTVAMARAVTGVFLLLLIILSYTQNPNFIYILAALSIIFFAFEVFYKTKVLKEVGQQNSASQGNLADLLNLEAARLILRAKDDLGKFLIEILKEKECLFLLHKADLTKSDLDTILQSSSRHSIDWQKLISDALSWSKREKRSHIDKLDLLIATFSQIEAVQKIIFEKRLKEADLVNIVFWARQVFENQNVPFWRKPPETISQGISEFWTGGWTLETEKYSLDITKEIKKGNLSTELIDREKEMGLIEEVLARKEKRNIILVGAPGIGKRTIIYGLAEKSIRGLLPESLKYKRFLEVDVTNLTAGAAKGALEARIQSLLTEIGHAGNVVLFLPELENIAGGTGTNVNVTGFLQNDLSEGKLQVIATTTRENYRRFIEPNSSFSSLFEFIEIEEPEPEVTVRILEKSATEIERKNQINVTYKALWEIINLADRYLVERVLPGKAIDILSEAAAATSLKNKQLLGASDVQNLITQKTKIPVTAATGEEAKKLINLESILHERIIGQEEAISAVSKALRRARSIERETKRPIGSFLFLGPTGVGKTETAKALSDLYFQGEQSIIREDMSEYQDVSSLNKLIGAPPGTGKYEEGGEFSEKVRQNPYSLILLDEIEKAHPKIQETFLPVFDEGSFQDATGRKIIFTNTILIATSNAGAEFIRESIQQRLSIEELKKQLLEKLQRENLFKPEFLNRFDDIVVYKPLSEKELTAVTGLMVIELQKRLERQDIYLSVGEDVLKYLAKEGYDPEYGARPLRRYIADSLEEKLAEKILSGEVKRGNKVEASLNNGTISFKFQY